MNFERGVRNDPFPGFEELLMIKMDILFVVICLNVTKISFYILTFYVFISQFSQ